MSEKTIWIMSGEASGDMYGAVLAQELRRQAPGLKIRGMGGVRMREAGVDLFIDSSELGIVGFIEVFKKARFFIRLLKDTAEKARREKPDAVVLIDYPGFNLRLAARLHEAGIPVVYYISPQVWAWKKGRIPKIAASVNRLLCIFPFEPACYAGTGLRADFIGHPLLDILAPLREKAALRAPNLALILPGSRSSELKSLLPVFLQTAEKLKAAHPDMHFAMPLPREKTKALAEEIIARCKPSRQVLDCLEISVGNTRELMTKAVAALAASGTVTVEAAMLGLPVVVSYKVNFWTYLFARMVIKLDSITIANLVTERTVFQECLQYDATPEKLSAAVEAILPGGDREQDVKNGMLDFVRRLGGQVSATQKAAQAVLEEAGLK